LLQLQLVLFVVSTPHPTAPPLAHGGAHASQVEHEVADKAVTDGKLFPLVMAHERVLEPLQRHDLLAQRRRRIPDVVEGGGQFGACHGRQRLRVGAELCGLYASVRAVLQIDVVDSMVACCGCGCGGRDG
jgi:hypothetical protein